MKDSLFTNHLFHSNVIYFIYGAIALVAAITDLRSGKIYNWLTIPAVVLAFILTAVFSTPFILATLAGFAVAAAIFLPLYAGNVVGGGDAKMALALGAICGPVVFLRVFAASFILVAFAGVVILIRSGRVKIFMKEAWQSLRSLFVPGLVFQMPRLSREYTVPYAVALVFAYAGVIMVERGLF